MSAAADGSPALNPYEAPKAPIESATVLPRLATQARVARAFLFLSVPMIIASAVLAVLRYAGVLDVNPPRLASLGAVLALGFGCVTFMVRFGTTVSFLVWMHTAYVRATNRVADARFTPLASVVWWFVPFANLWLPFAAMCHLWQLSRGGAAWRHVSPPAHLAVWWLAFALALCVLCAAFAMVWSPSAFSVRPILEFAVPCLAVVAALLAARIVGEITVLQRERLGRD